MTTKIDYSSDVKTKEAATESKFYELPEMILGDVGNTTELEALVETKKKRRFCQCCIIITVIATAVLLLLLVLLSFLLAYFLSCQPHQTQLESGVIENVQSVLNSSTEQLEFHLPEPKQAKCFTQNSLTFCFIQTAVITCPLLEPPINGSMYYSESFTAVGVTATYGCSTPELGLSGGDSVRTCSPSGNSNIGQWSGKAPLCKSIHCYSIPPPQNGQITFAGNGTAPFDYGTTAVYSCDSGYVLTSDRDSESECGPNGIPCDPVRACGSNGTSIVGEWSGDNLVCISEDPCLTKLYILAFTSSMHQFAGSDGDHSVEIAANQEVHHVILPDLLGDDYSRHKGDLWKINFSDFGFSDSCITIEEISRVSILATHNDGWNIDSITTFVIYTNGSRVLTQDFDVHRWIDGNADISYRRFDLTLA